MIVSCQVKTLPIILHFFHPLATCGGVRRTGGACFYLVGVVHRWDNVVRFACEIESKNKFHLFYCTLLFSLSPVSPVPNTLRDLKTHG